MKKQMSLKIALCALSLAAGTSLVSCGSTTSAPSSYSSTSISSSSSSTDISEGEKVTSSSSNSNSKASEVEVESISLNETSKTLSIGSSFTLSASVLPENATNKTIKWSVDDSSIASVKDGVVTALKEGNTTVYATSASGNKKASCSITVSNLDSNGNVVIKNYTKKKKFLAARANTVDNKSYQYDYELSASLAFSGAEAKVAAVSGTTCYNENATNTQYLQKRVTQAGLLLDSTSYTFNNGTTLLKVNEDAKKLSVEDTSSFSGFDHKNASFNKLINNIKDDVMEEGSDASDGKYTIKLKKDFTINSFINITGSIDVDYLVKLLNSVQDTVELSLDAYVTYQDNYFKDFVFSGKALVKNMFTIDITYKQTYSNVGKDISISTPSFAGYAITESEVNSELSAISSSIASFKSKANSSFEYNTKTAVDHGISQANKFGCAVNSTSKGDARRVISSNKVYYNNDLEFDSDYKNSDQYTSNYVKDYHVYRAKLNDGKDSARDEIVNTLKNSFADAIDAGKEDEYYFLYDNYLNYNYVKAICKSQNASKGTITYSLGLNNAGAKLLLDDYNKSIRINGSHNVTSNPGHIDVYQIQDSFSTKKAEIEITLNSSTKALVGISTYIKGYYEAVKASVKSPGANQFVKFVLDAELSDFDMATSYKIPTKDKDIR